MSIQHPYAVMVRVMGITRLVGFFGVLALFAACGTDVPASAQPNTATSMLALPNAPASGSADTPINTPTSRTTPTPISLQAPACTLPPSQFTKVEAPFSVDPETPGTSIPRGSTIYHWANGITEVDGPNGDCMLVANDSDAPRIGLPSGSYNPATLDLALPGGKIQIQKSVETTKDGTENITRYYMGDTVIVTKVYTTADYAYASGQPTRTPPH